MIEIVEYEDHRLHDAATIFCQLSAFHLKDNASSYDVVKENLETNILSDKSSVTIVLAYCDGHVCGLASYALLYPATKETAQMFLKELFVAPDYWHKGVGYKLMSFLAKVALESNCSRFDWTANSDNAEATEFYRKLGAPIIEKKQYYRLSGDNLKKMAERT